MTRRTCREHESGQRDSKYRRCSCIIAKHKQDQPSHNKNRLCMAVYVPLMCERSWRGSKLRESFICITFQFCAIFTTTTRGSVSRHSLLFLRIQLPRAIYLYGEMSHQRRHAVQCSLNWQITGSQTDEGKNTQHGADSQPFQHPRCNNNNHYHLKYPFPYCYPPLKYVFLCANLDIKHMLITITDRNEPAAWREFPLISFHAELEINKWSTTPSVQTGSSVHRTGRQEASLGTPAPNTIVVVSSLALQARDRHWENKQCLSVTSCTDRGSRMHRSRPGNHRHSDCRASPQVTVFIVPW